MAKNAKLAPSEGAPRRSVGSNTLAGRLNLRSVLIGAALVLVGAIGGGMIDHRMRAEGPGPERFGVMGSMMDDDHGPGDAPMGGGFGGEMRGQVVGTVVAVAGDKLTLNTVNGDVILTIGSGTTYTSTAPASVTDLTVGAAVQVRLDRGSPMQAGEIEITK